MLSFGQYEMKSSEAMPFRGSILKQIEEHVEETVTILTIQIALKLTNGKA